MRNEIITRYALDVSTNLLSRLDTIAQIENIKNGWAIDKYISLDPINADTWKLNLYGMDEDIIFIRESPESKYFKMI